MTQAYTDGMRPKIQVGPSPTISDLISAIESPGLLTEAEVDTARVMVRLRLGLPATPDEDIEEAEVVSE